MLRSNGEKDMVYMRKYSMVPGLILGAVFFGNPAWSTPETQTLPSGGSASIDSAGSTNTQAETVEGPMREARQSLLKKIRQAQSEGIGVAAYMQAFQALEAQVKTGTGEPAIGQRVENIQRSLEEQLKKSKILKTQRPIPPRGSQVHGSPAESAPVSAAKAASGAADNSGSILDKLKAKYGDRIENLPPGLQEQLKDPDTRQKLIDKFKGR